MGTWYVGGESLYYVNDLLNAHEPLGRDAPQGVEMVHTMCAGLHCIL